MKIVIIGARKMLEPLEILYIPQTQSNAEEKCKNAIDEADEVWVYLDGAGEDSLNDYWYAKGKKPIKIIHEDYVSAISFTIERAKT